MSAAPAEELPSNSHRFAQLALIGVTLLWGGTFLVTRMALADAGPFGTLTGRFTLGTLALLFLFRTRMRAVTRAELGAGALIGAVSFASYAFQTAGLVHIVSSRSAFITALYVPAVPILQLLFLRAPPRRSAWIGIASSFLGLLLLSADGAGKFTLGPGELLTLGSALTAAGQIILISRYAPGADPIRLATIQLLVITLLSLVGGVLSGEAVPVPSGTFLLAIGALGLLGSALAITIMNWAQQTISATRATIIYALEPVWAGIFGALAGETMTMATLAGSAMIILGILVSQLRLDPGRAFVRRRR